MSLFGDKGITPSDLTQGYIGNCWFIAAVAALAEFPGRAEKLFLNLEKKASPNGIYGMNIYTLGMPTTVIVDDWLPLWRVEDKETGTTSYHSYFAKVSEDLALWGPIVEKVFAKRFGNYEHLENGLPNKALQSLIGAPFDEYIHSNVIDPVTTLWDVISSADNLKHLITAGTEAAASDQIKNDAGLALNHAYTVLGTKILSDKKTRLLKVRNPWGAEGFKGSWSDNSEKWTPEFIKEVGHVKKNEGIFWISIEDYAKNFSETWVNYYPETMSRAAFLMLNDDNLKPKYYATYDNDYEGTWTNFCGDGCTKHKMTLKSTKDQTVYLTAHTWDDRGIADECEVDTKDVKHSMYI